MTNVTIKEEIANKIVGAFETWNNGGIQTSALYLASEDGQDKVNDFIEGNKGSFATLHTFTSEAEAIEAFYSPDNDGEEENEVFIKDLKKAPDYQVLSKESVTEYDFSGPSWSHGQRTYSRPEAVIAYGKTWVRHQVNLGAGDWYSVYRPAQDYS